MSSTNTASDELRDILTNYCSHYSKIPDIESIKNPLTQVSEALRYELLSSITDSDGDTVLTVAAKKGHTELCVTLLSSLPQADRLKLILVNKHTALDWPACGGNTETISGILNCVTADQQLQLLFTQDSDSNTALHCAAQWGQTETVKTLLDNLTPEQQLLLLAVQNKKGKTASEEAAGHYKTDAKKTLENYQKEADYKVFRKFVSLINNF